MRILYLKNKYKRSVRLLPVLFCPLFLVLLILPQFIFGFFPPVGTVVFFSILFLISLFFSYFLNKEKFLLLVESRARLWLLLSGSFYAVFWIIFTVFWLDNFLFLGQNLILFSQSLWSTMNAGMPLYNSIEGVLHFGIHNSPILLFFAPLYQIWPDPQALLFIRAVCLSLSIFPLYLIMRFNHSRAVSFILSVSFLFYLPVLTQMLFDFQEIQFLPLILFFTYYFWKKKEFLAYMIFSLLCLFVREELSSIVFMFGVYSFIKKREWKWILTPILLGGIWGLLSFKLIIPFFSKNGQYYFNHIVFADLLKPDLNARPMIFQANIQYLYWLLGPLLLILPFLNWEWILILPVLLGCLYTSYMPAKYIGSHYQMAAAAVFFISLGSGINYLSQKLQCWGMAQQKAKFSLALSVFLAVIAFSGAYYLGQARDFQKLTNSSPQVLREAVGLVGPEGSFLGPRYVINAKLNNRIYIYYCTEFFQPQGIFQDFVLIDGNTNDLLTKNSINKKFFPLINHPDIYKKIFDQQGVQLYKLSLPKNSRNAD